MFRYYHCNQSGHTRSNCTILDVSFNTCTYGGQYGGPPTCRGQREDRRQWQEIIIHQHNGRDGCIAHKARAVTISPQPVPPPVQSQIMGSPTYPPAPTTTTLVNYALRVYCSVRTDTGALRTIVPASIARRNGCKTRLDVLGHTLEED